MGPINSFLIGILMFTLPVVMGNVRKKRIVGGDEAAVPPEDDPLVFVYKHGHDARIYGRREKPGGFYAFRGIKYAEPPIGRFRFQRARRLRLDGEINATMDGPPCPQRGPKGVGVIGNEDCLSLNVFTPELADDSDGLAVLVWIHGGGFRSGSAAQYGAAHLVDKKLVVVTIQYRLGSLGFFGTGLKEQPGNVGLFDMTLALDWVKEYVVYFGGNPDKVTVSGQDTGASSAILMAMSTSGKGYLGGVIAMSGSALSAFAVDSDPMSTSRDLATQNSCPTTPVLAMIRCLQRLSVERLITADSRLQNIRLASQGVVASLASLLSASPVVEGEDDKRFLPNFLFKPPLDLLKSGSILDVPLLTGVTKDQTATALRGGLRKDVENRIKSIPTFLESTIKDLVTSTASSIANTSISLAVQISTSYFQFLPQLGEGANKVNEALNKIIEASGDALFNFPAFQTANLWSRKAPAFFYSFDHLGKKKGGPMFLESSPLTQQSDTQTDNKDVGHGDDLLYVFEPHSIDGSRDQYEGLDDPIDVRVRETTTTMIAEFARTGVPKVESQATWPSFKQGSSDFMSISADPKPGSNFRQCQMALWAGLTDQLQSVKCQAFGGLGSVGGVLGGVAGNTGSVLASPTNAVKPLGQVGEVGGSVMSGQVLGLGRGGTNRNGQSNARQTTRKPAGRGLGLPFGG